MPKTDQEPIELPQLPISIHDLQTDARTADLPCGVTVTYRPNLVTQGTMAAIERQMSRENLLGACKLIATFITNWDLVGPVETLEYNEETDEVVHQIFATAGETVPMDPAIMQHLNPAILAVLALEVTQDCLPLAPTLMSSRSR